MMERNIDEILLSQAKMIENVGGARSAVANDVLKKVFGEQLDKAKGYISSNRNFTVFNVDYNNLVTGNTEIITELDRVLDLGLDVGKACSVIDNSLYRNRCI